ncbi:MAG: hypothetical protein ACUVQ8_00690 [Nitrososphaeria archaeon]
MVDREKKERMNIIVIYRVPTLSSTRLMSSNDREDKMISDDRIPKRKARSFIVNLKNKMQTLSSRKAFFS